MTSRLQTALLGISMVAAVGCSSMRIEEHPEYDKVQIEVADVVKQVRETTGPELYPLLKRLVAYDVFAVDQVVELTGESNSRLRGNAIWVLGQIYDPDYPDSSAKAEEAVRDALQDPDQNVRYEAAAALVTRDQWDVIPMLLEGMQDRNPRVRFNCHESLKLATSKDWGYAVDDTTEEREAAIRRWSSWYEAWRNGEDA
jgi:HEAT repeat protein